MIDHFGDRLVEKIRQRKSFLCIGIDPHLELIPEIFNSNNKINNIKMVHIDGHEIAMLSTISGAIGVTHGIYGKGWFKSFIHRQPIIAFSVAIGGLGICMPLVIVPLRRSLGLPTNQYDATHPGTVFPKLVE